MNVKIHVYPLADGEFCAYCPNGGAVSIIAYGATREAAFADAAGRAPWRATVEQVDYPTLAAYRESLTAEPVKVHVYPLASGGFNATSAKPHFGFYGRTADEAFDRVDAQLFKWHACPSERVEHGSYLDYIKATADADACESCFGLGCERCCCADCDELFGPDGECGCEDRSDDSDDYGEGRMFAGMAHGNRGLADYGGLDLDGPGECGQHCHDCPRCGY